MSDFTVKNRHCVHSRVFEAKFRKIIKCFAFDLAKGEMNRNKKPISLLMGSLRNGAYTSSGYIGEEGLVGIEEPCLDGYMGTLHRAKIREHFEKSKILSFRKNLGRELDRRSEGQMQ